MLNVHYVRKVEHQYPVQFDEKNRDLCQDLNPVVVNI